MTIPYSNEVAAGMVEIDNKVYKCTFGKRVYNDMSGVEHTFDGGTWTIEGIAEGKGGIVTVHTPARENFIAKASRRGNTIQIRQKGEIWIVITK